MAGGVSLNSSEMPPAIIALIILTSCISLYIMRNAV